MHFSVKRGCRHENTVWVAMPHRGRKPPMGHGYAADSLSLSLLGGSMPRLLLCGLIVL